MTSKGQKQIKKKKGVKVKLKGAKLDRKLKLRATSKTFDTQEFKNLTKKAVLRPGRRTVKLKLNNVGRDQIKSCEARKITVSAKGAKAKFKLARNTQCAPKPIDLSRAEHCDLIGVDEASARTALPAAVPRRLPHGQGQVDGDRPAGRLRRRRDAAERERRADRRRRLQPQRRLQPRPDDRRSGSRASTRRRRSRRPTRSGSTDLGRYTSEGLAGRRGRHEDRQALADLGRDRLERDRPPSGTALLIHPAKNFDAGHRYIVAMRKLEDGAGNRLEAPEGFRYYRDDLPSNEAAINAQRKRFDKVFRALRKAKVKRRRPLPGLGLHRRQRREHRRADAPHPRRRLRPARRHQPRRRRGPGRRARASRSTAVENFTDGRGPGDRRGGCGAPSPSPAIWTRLRAAGGTFTLDPNGKAEPARAPGPANFNCIVPHAAVDGPAPRRAVPRSTVTACSDRPTRRPRASQQLARPDPRLRLLRHRHDRVLERGHPEYRRQSSRTSANFPQLTDRVQQGMLNELLPRAG